MPQNQDPLPAYTALESVLAMAEQTVRMLVMTRALVQSGRRVDLTGLDQGVQVLCAKAFDLEPGETGLVHAELSRLRDELDALAAALPGASAVTPGG